VNDIYKYLDWLLKQGYINVIQHCAAADLISAKSIEASFGHTGFNRREEFDR